MANEDVTLRKSYYVHTPKKSSPGPGAYLRLGSYSDVEWHIQSNDNRKQAYYPKQALTDYKSDEQQKNFGIMLACDGRILLRSSDKIYMHSKDEINIYTEKTFTVTSDDEMLLKTNNDKNITLDANGTEDSGGKVVIKGNSGMELHHGKYWSVTTKDSYSLKYGDTYTYTKNKTFDLKMSAAFEAKMTSTISLALGFTFSLTAGITIAISVASAIFNLNPIGLKADFSLLTFKASKSVVENDLLNAGFYSVSAKAAAAKAEKTEMEARMNTLETSSRMLWNEVNTVQANSSEVNVTNVSIQNTFAVALVMVS